MGNNLFERVAKRFGFVREDRQAAGRRSFDSAQNSRLTSDWLTTYTSADAEIRTARRTLIARCRSLERDNDYVRGYLRLLENNVLGWSGVGLQMKIQDPSGAFDKVPNQVIEAAWGEQRRPENWSVTGDQSGCEADRLVLRSAARDSGCLVRIVRGYANKPRYAIQLLEIDHLDQEYNCLLANGNEIRMGVEKDSWGKVQAYHIFKSHPGDLLQVSRQRRERVPSSDMRHIYLPERIGQTVGVPWLVSAILRLKMLGGYEEAELIASREAACKGYAIESTVTEEFTGADDGRGNALQDIEPGMGLRLNPGEKYTAIDPKHPTDAYAFFVKAALRGIGTGLGVSYNSLANDLESVNYSSIRAGLLEEREEWKRIQGWLIERLHGWLFQDWLETQMGFGFIKMPPKQGESVGAAVPASRFAKFNQPEWKPRRWPWVDPLKDLQAAAMAVEKGFSSRRRIISENGLDVEDVFLEQKEDKDLAESYGLEFPIEGVQSSPGEEGVAPQASTANNQQPKGKPAGK